MLYLTQMDNELHFTIFFCFLFLFILETQLDNVNEFNRNLNYVNIGQLEQTTIGGVGVGGGQVEQVCAYNIDKDSHFHGHQLYCKFCSVFLFVCFHCKNLLKKKRKNFHLFNVNKILFILMK